MLRQTSLRLRHVEPNDLAKPHHLRRGRVRNMSEGPAVRKLCPGWRHKFNSSARVTRSGLMECRESCSHRTRTARRSRVLSRRPTPSSCTKVTAMRFVTRWCLGRSATVANNEVGGWTSGVPLRLLLSCPRESVPHLPQRARRAIVTQSAVAQRAAAQNPMASSRRCRRQLEQGPFPTKGRRRHAVRAPRDGTLGRFSVWRFVYSLSVRHAKAPR